MATILAWSTPGMTRSRVASKQRSVGTWVMVMVMVMVRARVRVRVLVMVRVRVRVIAQGEGEGEGEGMGEGEGEGGHRSETGDAAPVAQQDRGVRLLPDRAPRVGAARGVAGVGPDVVGAARAVPVRVEARDVAVGAPVELRVAP